ncbi:MAG: DUF721 domain-containing protein [Deltaproteobacteria bacterium]|nr:DUF721 domain-containing protein [Deltaproteobacteria bacterium]
MRKRSQSAKLQHLGDILQTILQKHKIFIRSEETHLSDTWNRAVGPQIAAQTRPARIKKNTLFVNVSTSIWMQQLHFLKEEIMEKYNLQSGREPITNIYFSIGEISPPWAKKTHQSFLSPEYHLLKERDKKLIEKSTASIADEELRNILKRVLMKSIIRKRHAAMRKVP